MKKNEQLFIGIDIGTSSCKASVFNIEGDQIKKFSSSYGISRPNHNWVEQNPEDYWTATLNVLKNIGSSDDINCNKIKGIGVVGQTPTEIFVDKSGIPLRNAMIWQDVRAQEEANILKKEFGQKKLKDILGIPIPISASWSASKILWISRNEPNIAKRTYKILQPKDFINYKLTGKYFSDNWTSKSLAHLKSGNVNKEYLNFLGFTSNVVPAQYMPFEVAGYIKNNISQKTGIPSGVPVVSGWSDAAAAMLASGAFFESGVAFNCTGTSEIVGITGNETKFSQELMTIPDYAIGSVMSLYGPTQSGGGSLAWYNDAFNLNWNFKIAQNIENIIFLPYLEGERAPIWDPDAKGVFVGIKTKHNQSNFARAVLEGVAFSVRHVLETAVEVTGIEPDRIRLTGGGSRNQIWNQIRADVLGITVETLVVDDSSTLGGAMLAALGTGYYENMSEVSLKMAKIKEKFEPRDEYNENYNDLYSLYKEVYKSMSSLFPKF